MEKFIRAYERNILGWGVHVLNIPLFLMTIIEVLNTIGRKAFVPFPCAVEAVESLLVVCVYFGVSVVALEGGHINVVVLTEKFPKPVQSVFDAAANFLGAVIFAFLSYAAWLKAVSATAILELRIGVYAFPVWPFRIFFAFGLTMLTFQLIINVIKHYHAARGKTDYAGMDRIRAEEVPEL